MKKNKTVILLSIFFAMWLCVRIVIIFGGTPSDKIKSTNPSTRIKAVHGLAKKGDSASIVLLVGALKDENENVRTAALQSIVEFHVFDTLITMLHNSNESTQDMATWAMGEIGDQRAIGYLISFAYDNGNTYPPVSKSTVKALNKLNAAMPLVNLLSKGCDNTKRLVIAYYFGETHNQRVIEPLHTLLTDSCSDVRYAAIWALDAFHDSTSVLPLISLLKDPDYFVQQTAIEVLGRFRDARAVIPLCLLLKDARDDMRASLATALGAIGDVHSVPFLIRAMDDQKVIAAVDALGSIGTDEAISALCRNLKSDDRNLLSATGYALYRHEEKLSNVDKLYMYIATDKKDTIDHYWPDIKVLLLGDLKKQSTEDYAINTLISFKRDEIIPEMITIMNKLTNPYSVLKYHNSGNDQLKEAANIWFKKHGYALSAVSS
jgi:HEAT repeat protein